MQYLRVPKQKTQTTQINNPKIKTAKNIKPKRYASRTSSNTEKQGKGIEFSF